jgi:RND family efflux transporter MFP subunit
VIGAETGNLRITEILVDVGSTVKKGQLMARLSDATVKADLDKQDAVVDQAQVNLAQAQKNLARIRAAADSGALSSQKIDETLATEATSRATLASVSADRQSAYIRLQQTRILAVDDGIVTSRTAILGNVISGGAELFRLVRQGRMEWRAELDAEQLSLIKQGQTAELSLPGGNRVVGAVRLVSPTLSSTTGRALVFVSLPPGSGAQPGMFASGSIELAKTPALTLPQSAVVLRDGRNDVYVLPGNGDAVTRRTIKTGRRYGDRIEVVSGLDDQSRVVASGGAFLSEGTRVRIETPSINTAPKS